MIDSSNRDSFRIQADDSGVLTLILAGDWRFCDGIPQPEKALQAMHQAGVAQRLVLDGSRLGSWDSGLLTFLVKVIDHCRGQGMEADTSVLPDGVRHLLKLAYAVPERREARRRFLGQPILARIGNLTLEIHRTWWDAVSFIGEACLALINLLRRRANFRTIDFFYLLESCGAQALPIVTLISLLVGMILAFVGAVQLRIFGAGIFVANLVALGMAREMAAMMTAVIMAGRTGAAFAAQLGTMQVNEELDALRTMGISPMEFLVLPRLLALTLMLPLLCMYSMFMGILGGALVSAWILDISFFEYYIQAQSAVGLTHFVIGVVKSAVFGVIVALAGCLRGVQCGRSASAVGFAATSAVVTSIVLIVVADAVITIVCQVLGV